MTSPEGKVRPMHAVLRWWRKRNAREPSIYHRTNSIQIIKCIKVSWVLVQLNQSLIQVCQSELAERGLGLS